MPPGGQRGAEIIPLPRERLDQDEGVGRLADSLPRAGARELVQPHQVHPVLGEAVCETLGTLFGRGNAGVAHIGAPEFHGSAVFENETVAAGLQKAVLARGAVQPVGHADDAGAGEIVLRLERKPVWLCHRSVLAPGQSGGSRQRCREQKGAALHGASF